MSRPSSSRSSPAGSSAADVHLPDPPRRTVSAVSFSPNPASSSVQMVVSSWDHHVHHYSLEVRSASSSTSTSADAHETVRKVQTFQHEAPVLDVCCITDTLAASACVDRRVRLLDLRTAQTLILGKHADSVLKVRWCPQSHLLISASTDRTLSFWDLAPITNTDRDTRGDSMGGRLLKTLDMPDKVIALDVSPPYWHASDDATRIDATPRLVVGMAGRHVYVYDLLPLRAALDKHSAGESVAERDWEPDQKRESSLKFMARDLRCMPAGDGYATSSIEGRVAVEFFDPSPKVQAMKYAFKCHRETIADTQGEQTNDNNDEKVDGEPLEKPYDVVYPVHAIAFHPRHGTFASLGGDALISVWDAAAKKRIRQYPKLSAPVTAGAFDPTGNFLLVATGNDSIDSANDNDDKVDLILKPNVWDQCKPKSQSSSASSASKK